VAATSPPYPTTLPGLFKQPVRKCIRWYIHPQVAALEQELSQVREKLVQLERLRVQTQSFT
jgi:hypothetical protein